MVKAFLNKIKHSSIRTKILFLGTGLVLISFATYLPYILNSFLKDKKAYIYDAVLSESHEMQSSVTRILESKEKDVLTYSLRDPGYFKSDAFKKNAIDENLLQYERYLYAGQAQFKKTISTDFEPALRNHSLEKKSLEELTRAPLERFPSMILRKKYIEYIRVGEIPLIHVFLYDERNHVLHFATYVGDEVSDQFSKNASFSN